MTTLHTVHRSPYERDAFEQCLAHALDGSSLLLVEDGVYAAQAHGRFDAAIRDAIGRLRMFALGPDLKARGLEPARLVAGIEIVGYDGFVDLAVEHDKVQAWL